LQKLYWFSGAFIVRMRLAAGTGKRTMATSDGRRRDDKAGTITPVILSGGSGTRLWPMSRAL